MTVGGTTERIKRRTKPPFNFLPEYRQKNFLFFFKKVLTNHWNYGKIDTERGENKSPEQREVTNMRVEKDLSKMTKIAENEKYDFYVRKFGKTDWYAYAMEKGTNIAVTMAGTNRMKSIVEIVNSWAGWMK